MSKATLFDSRIKKYAYCKPPEICRDLGTSALGLSKEQVDTMRERYGKNSFQERKTDTTIQRLRRAFINPFHVILFILGIVSLVTDVFMASNFTRNATTALIIFSMIVISGVIRLIQELRAKSTAAQLDRLIHEKVTVRRNGELREIPGEELVVGDLVLFSAGDRVPADIRLTKVTDLFISQAAITGESAILEKSCRTLCYKEQEPITQLENLAFMATTVISGKGEGIVLAVGTDTLYGGFTKPDSEDKNSFQKGANSIAWVMIRFMAVLVPIVFLILGITGGKWLESFAFALSVAVGLMPEMLPMVITACLAKGSLAMGKKQTIIKDLNAMQSFGSMDVLCMDKTGTLTNESILLEYYMDILGNENTEVLDLAYLNSSYHSGVRNPIDNAILACKSMPGREIHYAKLLTEYQKKDEIPFDYTRKFVSTLVQDSTGNSHLIMKGDIAHILSRCSHVEYRGTRLPMEKDARQSVFSVVGEMLQDGMKVIAVARKNVGISVDTAVDAAKDAADVVLLQKDLNVLEQGVLEGRKTFTNMLKYIKITASSNFGNIFSIICASAFLPFLPMTSIQILLLNLLYDTLCIVLPWDNVDEEEILSPRDWSGKTLKQFMLSFGPISSLFDIVTFLFLYYFLCPALCGGATYLQLTDPSLKLQYAALFQTGWFLESMWTQVLILHFLRTAKIPFLQSRASAPVISITLVGILAFTALTFTSGASLFGLTKLPLWYFAFLLLVAFFYMLLSSVTKYFYKNKYQELI